MIDLMNELMVPFMVQLMVVQLLVHLISLQDRGDASTEPTHKQAHRRMPDELTTDRPE